MKRPDRAALTAILVLLIFGAAFLLRIININKVVSGDETEVLTILKSAPSQLLHAVMEKGYYPPLTYVLTFLWKGVVGSEPYAVRLYFVLFGMGVLGVAYLMGREYLDKKFATIYLLLAAFSPLLIFLSQYARSYIDSAFWMLLSGLFMMRILNGNRGVANWFGYIISASLSLYTFYFSGILIASQLLYVTIIYRRDWKILLKWYVSISLVVASFLPWIPFAVKQMGRSPALLMDHLKSGFNIGGLHLGMYVRDIFALIGMDPYFMVVSGGVDKYISKTVLIVICAAVFFAFAIFLLYCWKGMKERFEGNPMLWFPIYFSIVPIILAWLAAIGGSALVLPRYIGTFHVYFLMMVSFLVYRLMERKNKIMSLLVLAAVLAVFSLRIPEATSVEIDSQSADVYLSDNMTGQDVLVYMRLCPQTQMNGKMVSMIDSVKLSAGKNRFKIDSSYPHDELVKRFNGYKRVWFYRAGGTVESFGANDKIDEIILQEGYERRSEKNFKNIKLVLYEKP